MLHLIESEAGLDARRLAVIAVASFGVQPRDTNMVQTIMTSHYEAGEITYRQWGKPPNFLNVWQIYYCTPTQWRYLFIEETDPVGKRMVDMAEKIHAKFQINPDRVSREALTVTLKGMLNTTLRTYLIGQGYDQPVVKH